MLRRFVDDPGALKESAGRAPPLKSDLLHCSGYILLRASRWKAQKSPGAPRVPRKVTHPASPPATYVVFPSIFHGLAAESPTRLAINRNESVVPLEGVWEIR